MTKLASENRDKKIIIKYVERFCLKNVYKVLVTAKTDSLFLQKLYNNLSISFHTIYNYPMQINANKGDNYLRKNFNIKNQNRILIYQGVIQRGRGIKKLINIIKNTKNFVGFIVGSGEAENYYKEYVKASFLENKIMEDCFCIEGGNALHFVNEEVLNSVSFSQGKNSYLTNFVDKKIVEKELPRIDING